MAYIAVVGAANVDVGGFPSGKMIAGDSNPGRVRLSMGGVGRNIACNAARLGVPTQLVAPLGGDAYAELIQADCARAGVGLDFAPRFPDATTSTYLFIADPDGEMTLAVNDMDILSRMTPQVLAPALDALDGAALVVLDANLPAATLEFLAERLRPPILADAVSAAKARRLTGALSRLDALKPNRIEAEALTGIPVADEASARRAAEALTAMGVRRVFLTLGAQGVCCADARQTRFLPGPPARARSVTGAGDAFVAALAWAKLRDLSLTESALAGMAAASLAMESMDAVNPALSQASLEQRISQFKSGGTKR